MQGKIIIAGLLAAAFGAGAAAPAIADSRGAYRGLAAREAPAMSEKYEFTGTVMRITPDLIEVDGQGPNGHETLQFRNSALQRPKDLHPGDQVTITYRLDAEKVRKRAEEPGQVPQEEDPAKKGIIRDDRAFYDARNESRPFPKSDPSPSLGG